jgi:hypothetical protein
METLYAASIIASAIRRLPRDHATALQHRRQGACEDADVMRRGYTWPRLSKAHDRCLRFSQEWDGIWYLLQASSTSAGPPILYGRIRPLSGERPKATEKGRNEMDPRLCGSASGSCWMPGLL